ncbi:MAG TPA: hypothetical protein VNQ56_04510 [Pseudolabrys sp.]|nr:hypothetical protein [Pseudolabrys sp.]
MGLVMVRGFVAAGVLLCSVPAFAGEMSAEQAQRFVIGKYFTYNCFEGTRGGGRVHADGSVVGTIQIRGDGPVRHARMPPGTLQVRGERVCASVRGLPIEPCFNLEQINDTSFRGAISGLGFAYCEFTRRGSGKVNVASGGKRPVSLSASAQDD